MSIERNRPAGPNKQSVNYPGTVTYPGLDKHNPIIRHKYTADPVALVQEDKVYLYTGHDETPPGSENYLMKDWLCFSSDDMVNWTEHPVPLKALDFTWAKGDAYASEVIYRNNQFYWYVAVTHAEIKGKAIGVAISDKPQGPFRDAIGAALITNDMTTATNMEKDDIDPTVLIDDDGQAYLFWGNTVCYYAKLKNNMLELDGEIRTVPLPAFSEGAFIYKRNGWYYLLYGYEMPEKVAYAMSRDINGPWEFKGIINDEVYNCETNLPAIVDFRGRSYFLYHNGALENGGSHRRSVCIDYLNFNPDNTIQKIIMT
ncbi:glycoside hydrolase family 43 protein [Flavitalea sp.]|nr:glycoside hydrolase family 43 protein [Flavitalea sp.]